VSTEIIEGLNSYIQQINEIDPHATNFRYAIGAAETIAALEKAQKHGSIVSLKNFSDKMAGLANVL
jgi:hypothetical protein